MKLRHLSSTIWPVSFLFLWHIVMMVGLRVEQKSRKGRIRQRVRKSIQKSSSLQAGGRLEAWGEGPTLLLFCLYPCKLIFDWDYSMIPPFFVPKALLHMKKQKHYGLFRISDKKEKEKKSRKEIQKVM